MRRRRRTRRRPYRRRRRLRRYRKRRRLMPVGGFPSAKLVKLRWVYVHTVNAGAGMSYDETAFIANSAAGPLYEVDTHEPVNYHYWMNRYQYCVVLGSRMTVYPMLSAAVNSGLMLGLQLKTINSAFRGDEGTVSELLQTTGFRWIHLYDPSRKYKLTMSFKATKFFRKNKGSIIGDAAYRHVVDDYPGTKAFFNLVGVTPDAGDAGAVTCRILIDYYCLLTEETRDAADDAADEPEAME